MRTEIACLLPPSKTTSFLRVGWISCIASQHPRSWVSGTCQPCHFVTCMDCSLPGSPVHGILQAILEWVVISFSRGSSWPRDRTPVSCIGRQILYKWATREIQINWAMYYVHGSDDSIIVGYHFFPNWSVVSKVPTKIPADFVFEKLTIRLWSSYTMQIIKVKNQNNL